MSQGQPSPARTWSSSRQRQPALIQTTVHLRGSEAEGLDGEPPLLAGRAGAGRAAGTNSPVDAAHCAQLGIGVIEDRRDAGGKRRRGQLPGGRAVREQAGASAAVGDDPGAGVEQGSPGPMSLGQGGGGFLNSVQGVALQVKQAPVRPAPACPGGSGVRPIRVSRLGKPSAKASSSRPRRASRLTRARTTTRRRGSWSARACGRQAPRRQAHHSEAVHSDGHGHPGSAEGPRPHRQSDHGRVYRRRRS